jgi:hypothetical protein
MMSKKPTTAGSFIRTSAAQPSQQQGRLMAQARGTVLITSD